MPIPPIEELYGKSIEINQEKKLNFILALTEIKCQYGFQQMETVMIRRV
jgi:hypothetical protein